jgi:hypothetical protein
MSYEERQQMILEVLAAQPGGGAESRAIAARALWSWEQMNLHLQPLIGEAGFLALYARTVHLTAPRVPRLTPVQQTASIGAVFAQLKVDLEALSATEAAQASNMLLNTFTDLLSTMIGESLTSRILRSAWTASQGDANAQEIKK